MPQRQRPRTVIDTLGEEIVRIVTPVSICMLLVVVLVSVLNTEDSVTVNSMATVAYTEASSDSDWDKLKGAVLNALVFVGVVTAVTFLLVLLFYLGCTKLLRYYMGFSSFVVLGFMGGEVALFLISQFNVAVDVVTFVLLLFNFAVVGVLAVFMSKMAIFVTQGYLVVIGVLVAYWFTLLPEWTTWSLLIAMALYDLAAVLLPVGPLRLLVELAISRDEDIPALVYEARPVVNRELGSGNGGGEQRRVWRERSGRGPDAVVSVVGDGNEARLVGVEEVHVVEGNAELLAPLIAPRPVAASNGPELTGSTDTLMLEGVGLGLTGAIKLGLGDFIFYSVLVGRAAMYDFMTVYACYLAIIAGLGITLMLLALYQKALPALPVSVALGMYNVVFIDLFCTLFFLGIWTRHLFRVLYLAKDGQLESFKSRRQSYPIRGPKRRAIQQHVILNDTYAVKPHLIS